MTTCSIRCPRCDGHCGFYNPPPAPPPMRVGNGTVPSSGLVFYLGMIVVCVTFGIYCGWKMAGAA